MTVNGPISPKQCYYEMDYSFYSFYWLDFLEIRLDHNSTYYRSLSKNSNVKPRISHCDSQNLQYKTHPEFWSSQRRIFKTSLYYKTRLILETRRYRRDFQLDLHVWMLDFNSDFIEIFPNGPVSTLRLNENRCRVADDIYKCIFLYENLCISIKTLLKFVPRYKHHWFR